MNYLGHFITITKHRHKVICLSFKAGIGMRGILHDLSKYLPAEFFVGAKNYQGYRSPNEHERENYGYSKAWLHHKGRNKHHFEYWADYSYTDKKLIPIKMPLKFVIEMFCDRVAAGMTYLGKDYTDASPYEYFQKAKATRFINSETSAFLESLLLMLKNEGEEKTFAYIRNFLRKNKNY